MSLFPLGTNHFGVSIFTKRPLNQVKNLQNEQAFFDLPLLGSRFHGFCSFRTNIFHLILPLVHSLSQPHDFWQSSRDQRHGSDDLTSLFI